LTPNHKEFTEQMLDGEIVRLTENIRILQDWKRKKQAALAREIAEYSKQYDREIDAARTELVQLKLEKGHRNRGK